MAPKSKNDKLILNVVPLRKMIQVPKIVIPILVGRKQTLDAVKECYGKSPTHSLYSSEK